MKRLHKTRTKRRGYVLVLFIMMFLCLMGLAALVIDMGFARLAQRQMQSAVDSAALEGLRWQSASPVFARQQASQRVAQMFSDYEDSGGTVHYGTGPVVNFTGGISPAELAAAKPCRPAPAGLPTHCTSTGTPGLELNLSNATEGDMVTGTSIRPAHRRMRTELHRRDFTPRRHRRIHKQCVFGSHEAHQQSERAGPGVRNQFRRPAVAGPVWPRQPDGTQRQWQPVERGVRDHGPRTAIAGPQPAKTVGPLYTSTIAP